MSADPQHELLNTFHVSVPPAERIRSWAAVFQEGAGNIITETDTDMLYVCQVRRYLRGLGPPPRRNGAAQAAWSDVCAALVGI